jgi:hypothetical protein
MRTTRTIAAALLLALAPIAFPPSVRAQAPAEDATTVMARTRFKEGVDFYDKGEYEQARASFLQVYALKKHPAILLNLGWSCLKSGHALEAERYFKQFFAEAKDITEKQRADANDGLAQSHAKLGRIEVLAGAGTEVTIDGVGAGTAPLPEPVVVEGGAHTVKFKGPDGATETQSITVMGGEKATARSKTMGTAPPAAALPPPLPPPPTPEATPSPPLPPPPKPAPEETGGPADQSPAAPETARPPTSRKGAFDPPKNVVPAIIFGSVAVAGYAGALVALVFKQQAQDRANQLDRTALMHCSANPDYCSAYTTDLNNVNDDATAGNVALGIGIAATAGAVVYWMVADKADAAHASTRPILTPMVGSNVGGLSLSGRF